MAHRFATADGTRKPILSLLVGFSFLLGWLPLAGASLVVDRHIAYATGIDPTKSALLPGLTSSGANIVNSQGGITDLYIDLAGVPSLSSIGLGDLDFRIGNSTDIASWALLSTAPAVSVTSGAGTGGADRLYLSWSPGAVENTWLEITLAANASTGLVAPDVFYFGHLLGDTSSDGQLSPIDALLVINELNSSGPSSSADGPGDPLDLNRDGFITPADYAVVVNALSSGDGSSLVTLSPPLPQPVPLPAAAWLFATALTGLLAVNRRRKSIACGIA